MNKTIHKYEVTIVDSCVRQLPEGAVVLSVHVQQDLRSIQARIEARRDYEAEKETGALLDEDTPAPPPSTWMVLRGVSWVRS